jgi:hypothetical protein
MDWAMRSAQPGSVAASTFARLPGRYGLFVEFNLIATEPVPVWAAAIDVETYWYHPPVTERALRESFGPLKRCTDFRGVSLSRLPTILAAGIDVEPTTAPFFVSDFNKAWEYGDWPKVIMALDRMHLDYTYREITSDTAADEAARLMLEYPTRIQDRSGERIWLTRLPETDPRAASSYEAEFARWIPGNPFHALRAVFVFMPEGDS